MPRTIYFRVGTSDRVPLYSFIDSLRAFLSTLQDLDAAISRDQRGSLVWEVVSLEKNSPPVVGVAPHQKAAYQRRGLRDFSDVVTEQLIENTRMLYSHGERNEYLSDSALAKLEKLAAKTTSIGEMAVYVSDNGKPKTFDGGTVISPQTFTNVKKLTGVRYSAYGSIVGNLDAISVHRIKAFEFRVWDETTNKPVTCKFEEKDLERVKSLLRSRVAVSGTLMSNSAGTPISITVEDLEPISKPANLPTIEEMSGLVKDFTGGKTMREYMEEISDE